MIDYDKPDKWSNQYASADRWAHKNIRRTADVEWCRMFNFDASIYADVKQIAVDRGVYVESPLLFRFHAIRNAKTELEEASDSGHTDRETEKTARVALLRAALEEWEEPLLRGGLHHPLLEEEDFNTCDLIDKPLHI